MLYQNRDRNKRLITVVIIACISILFGLLFDFSMTALEKTKYPKSFENIVSKYSSEFGVPEHIVFSVIKVESDFKSNAVSSKGAVGLMQITPDTFDWIALLLSESPEHGLLYDPETNIRYGTYLLSYLYSRFGNWDTVFAAYNRGMAGVYEWLEDPRYSDGNGNLTNIPVEETRNYLKKVRTSIEMYDKLYY